MNEIRMTGTLDVLKDGETEGMAETARDDFAGTLTADIQQTIPDATDTPMEQGGIPAASDLGWCMIKNLDQINEVKMLPGAGVAALITVPPGKFAGPFKLETKTPHLRTDNTNQNQTDPDVRVRIVLFEL